MSDNENLPLKIFNAFEDLYFEQNKDKIFDDIFSKYFCFVKIDGHMDLYDVLVALRTKHRSHFDNMVRELRDKKLI